MSSIIKQSERTRAQLEIALAKIDELSAQTNTLRRDFTTLNKRLQKQEHTLLTWIEDLEEAEKNAELSVERETEKKRWVMDNLIEVCLGLLAAFAALAAFFWG